MIFFFKELGIVTPVICSRFWNDWVIEKYVVVKRDPPPANAAYMRQWTELALVQVMAVRRQAITWTNATPLSTGPLGTNFTEMWIEI